MANDIREQNCSNCEYCSIGAVKRFKCNALPHSPGEWWDGYPEGHWCGVYWKQRVTPVKQIPVAPSKLEKKVS